MQFGRLIPRFQRNILPPSLSSTMYHIPDDCSHVLSISKYTFLSKSPFTYSLYISFYPYVYLFSSVSYTFFFSFLLHFCLYFIRSSLTSFPHSFSLCLLRFLCSYCLLFLRYSFLIYCACCFSFYNTFFRFIILPFFVSISSYSFLLVIICYNCFFPSCHLVSSYSTNSPASILI
jgi:hypothetical protein